MWYQHKILWNDSKKTLKYYHDMYLFISFYDNVEPSCIIHAEILSLYRGIYLCWSTGIRRVICYLDSLHVIQLTLNPLNMFHRSDNLISLIKKLLSQDWIVDLCHTLQEGNFAADCLDKLGATSFERLINLDAVPSN